MSIAWSVVLYNSIQSGPWPAGLASSSLMTTAPAAGMTPLSSDPGEPPGTTLGRQASGVLQEVAGASGYRTVNE